MQEYLRSLILVAAGAVLASLLLPEKNERMKRVLEFGISLLILTVICRPLADIGSLSALLDGIRPPDILTGDIAVDEDTKAAAEAAVGSGIAQDLAAHYGLPASCFTAKATLARNGSEIVIASLHLTVRGEGRLLDLYSVQEYAARTYQTNCEVMMDGG